jgi:hypothetical protein
VYDSLRKRIQSGESNGDGTQHDRQGIQLEHEESGECQQNSQDHKGMRRRQFAGCQGPLQCPCDMTIVRAISQIVEHDPRAPHEKGAQHKEEK